MPTLDSESVWDCLRRVLITYRKAGALPKKAKTRVSGAKLSVGPFAVEVAVVPRPPDLHHIRLKVEGPPDCQVLSASLELDHPFGENAEVWLQGFHPGQASVWADENFLYNPKKHSLLEKLLPRTDSHWAVAGRGHHRLGLKVGNEWVRSYYSPQHSPFPLGFDCEGETETLTMVWDCAAKTASAQHPLMLEVAWQEETEPHDLPVNWPRGLPKEFFIFKCSATDASAATNLGLLLSEFEKHRFAPESILLDIGLRPEDILQSPAAPNPERLAALELLAEMVHKAGMRAGLRVSPFCLGGTGTLANTLKPYVLVGPNNKPLPMPPAGTSHGQGWLLNPSMPEAGLVVSKTVAEAAQRSDFLWVQGFGSFLQAEFQGATAHEVLGGLGASVCKACMGKPVVLENYPWAAPLPSQAVVAAPTQLPRQWNAGASLRKPENRGSDARAQLLSVLGGAIMPLHAPHIIGGFTLMPKSKTLALAEEEKYALLLAHWLGSDALVLHDRFQPLEPLAKQNLQAVLPKRPIELLTALNDDLFFELALRVRNLHYRAYFNLSDIPYHFFLPPKGYCYLPLADAWQPANTPQTLAPHDALLVLHLPTETTAQYRVVGSTGHLLPGQEVESLVATEPGEVGLRLHPRALRQGKIWLECPQGQAGARVNGLFIRPQSRDGRQLLLVDARNCPVAE